MDFESQDLIKIGVSVLAGGLIGFEREFRDRAAGLRTLIFICLGSTAFTILSYRLAGGHDPTRIAANIITGIGFLGAGTILQDRGRVMGLTTAATIWFTAALGMVIGGGHYVLTVMLLSASLVVLWFFPMVERWISRIREERNYEIVCDMSPDSESWLMAEFRRHQLQVQGFQQKKTGRELHFFWRASGARKSHERLIKHLISSAEVKEFRV